MKPQIHGLRERKIPVAWNLAGGYQKPISKVMPSMKIRLERVLRRGSDHSFIATSKNNL